MKTKVNWVYLIGCISLEMIYLGYSPAPAQIIPDSSLGTENSQTILDAENMDQMNISGGATRGANLFHSFTEFNVNPGTSVYFSNPPDIQRIFSRVTGSNPSQILGTLGVSGNADLFLINPNGIIFGSGSKLDIKGSFISSTADSIVFDNGFEFSASNPQTPPLLTFNNPIGLRFIPQSIEFPSSEIQTTTSVLRVQNHQTLGLVANHLTFNTTGLRAESGRIELGAVEPNSFVSLTSVSNGWQFNYQPLSSNLPKINLSNNTIVQTSGTIEGIKGGDIVIHGGQIVIDRSSEVRSNAVSSIAGNIIIQGQELLIDQGSEILADVENGEKAGNIILDAQQITIQGNQTILSASSMGTGTPGTISITTDDLILQDGAEIQSSIFAAGNNLEITANDPNGTLSIFNSPGTITINATNSVQVLESGIFAQVEPEALGLAGNIFINTRNLLVQDGGQIATKNFNSGVNPALESWVSYADQGNLGEWRDFSFRYRFIQNDNVNDSLSATLSRIISSFSNSWITPSGNITINALDSIQVIDTRSGNVFPSSIFTDTTGRQNAGTLTLNTGTLLVQGGQIRAETIGEGAGGSLVINARDSITVSGRTPDAKPAGISTATDGAGTAGNLTLNTPQLTVDGGAVISSRSRENGGNGGSLTVTGERVTISGTGNDQPSAIRAESLGAGDAGSVTFKINELNLFNGGEVSVRSQQSGSAGILRIDANHRINVNGIANTLPSQITAETQGSGRGGELFLNSDQVNVTDGGQITAAALGAGDAGSLVIDANIINVRGGVGNIPSRISAETESSGQGGDLRLNSQQLDVSNGGEITAATRGTGNAGTLLIDADRINVNGVRGNVPSRISAETASSGQGGDLRLQTQQLNVSNGGEITAATRDTGNAGTLSISADTLEVNGKIGNFPSRISAETFGRGAGGSLSINANMIQVQNQGELSVSGFQLGGAGNLNLQANTIELQDQGSVRATTASGDRGNINVQTQALSLRRQSDITTNATNDATGGNVTITSDTIILGENSQITAQAEDGRGGNIQIETEVLIQSPDSLIDASSQRGIDGIVDINRPESDPKQGIIEFEEIPPDPADLIASGCESNDISPNQSQFMITRRGGMFPGAGEVLSPPNFAEDFRDIPQIWQGENLETTRVPAPSVSPSFSPVESITIAEAWHYHPQTGNLILTATPIPPFFVSQLLPNCTPDPISINDASPRQQNLIASTTPQFLATLPHQTITQVEKFAITGSTVFTAETLAAATAPFLNRPLSFAELHQAADTITTLYKNSGYQTSGAYLPPQTVENGIVELAIYEDQLRAEDIKITFNGNSRLHPNYIRSRLAVAGAAPLNPENLESALRLLTLNQNLIRQIHAELSTNPQGNRNILEVTVTPASPLQASLTVDNARNPSVGTVRRQMQLSHHNLLGWGDQLRGGYSNTDGSDALDISYTLPINPRNGTLSFQYSTGDSQIIEPPFDQLNLATDSRTYEITLRQPFQQTATAQNIQEIAWGVTLSRRESRTTLDGEPFPLSFGADEQGNTRLSVLRFFQDWTQQTSGQVISARSQFNLGLGIFDATVQEEQPDSRFLSWQGQGFWAKSLGTDALVLFRGSLQLTPDSLVPIEQFSLGGAGTIRGYRQDALLTDNGIVGSVEVWVPVYRFNQNYLLQVVPFLDWGFGWNSGGRETPDQNMLFSAGLGVQFRLGEKFTARLDWGIPLIHLDSRNRTWQESGLHFSLGTKLF